MKIKDTLSNIKMAKYVMNMTSISKLLMKPFKDTFNEDNTFKIGR